MSANGNGTKRPRPRALRKTASDPNQTSPVRGYAKKGLQLILIKR
jgi:hypothetical protein